MTNTKNTIQSGIDALFGSNSAKFNETIPSKSREELESEQISRRKAGLGRPRKGSRRAELAKEDMHTSIIVNRPQYDKLKEIAMRETLTVKEIVYFAFELAIECYEKKNGPVSLPEKPKGRKELFG